MQPNSWNQPPYPPQGQNNNYPYGFQPNGMPPQIPPVKPAPSPEFLEKKALQSFTMGILSSLGLFFPILAFVFGAIGIKMGNCSRYPAVLRLIRMLRWSI